MKVGGPLAVTFAVACALGVALHRSQARVAELTSELHRERHHHVAPGRRRLEDEAAVFWNTTNTTTATSSTKEEGQFAFLAKLNFGSLVCLLMSMFWISIPFTVRDETRRHWGDWAYYNYVDLSRMYWGAQKSVFQKAQSEFVHPMTGVVLKTTGKVGEATMRAALGAQRQVSKIGRTLSVKVMPTVYTTAGHGACSAPAEPHDIAKSIAHPPSSADGVIFSDKMFYHVETMPTVKLLLVRSGKVENDQMVHITLHNDTARALIDFEPLDSKEVVFNAGERTAFVEVRLIDNKVWEPNKLFHVSIDEGGADYSAKSFYMRRHDWCLTTVVITNDDPFPGEIPKMEDSLRCRLIRLRLYVDMIIRDLLSKLPHYFKKGFLVWLTLGYLYGALHSSVIMVQVIALACHGMTLTKF
jgi:hypothetical protein